MEKKQRKRQREEGKRGGGFKAADAWYDRGSTYKLPPLNLSLDGIACCDCVMCFIAQPQIPSGEACQIKSVHYLKEDQKLETGRQGQIAREDVRQCKTLARARESRKGKVMMGKVAGLPSSISYNLYHHILPPSSYVTAGIHRSSPCISL